jgi:hypothetical protein
MPSTPAGLPRAPRPRADQVELRDAFHPKGTSVSHFAKIAAHCYLTDLSRLGWALGNLRLELQRQAAWRGATDVIALELRFDPFAVHPRTGAPALYVRLEGDSARCTPLWPAPAPAAAPDAPCAA